VFGDVHLQYAGMPNDDRRMPNLRDGHLCTAELSTAARADIYASWVYLSARFGKDMPGAHVPPAGHQIRSGNWIFSAAIM